MTTNLLIFFAIPLAIIIISVALQKILRNPFLVAGITFSILLVIVLAFFEPIYLIAVVAYTVLSFITAFLTCLLRRLFRNINMCNCMGFGNNNPDNTNENQVIEALSDGNNNQIYSLNEGNNPKGNTYYTGCYRRR